MLRADLPELKTQDIKIGLYCPSPLEAGCAVSGDEDGLGSIDCDVMVFVASENRNGCGRYPFRVRTLQFFNLSPTNFTVIVRQPVLGLNFG